MKFTNLRRFRPAPVLAIGMLALGASATLTGCDDLANPLDALCCSDFDVGADLSGVDFEADATFNGWIQAVADFSGVASGMVTDLTGSCKALAIDLGAEDDGTAPSDPAAAVEFWCNLAVGQINTTVKANGSITIKAQPPACTVDFKAQASCEGSCQVDASCDPGTVEARCTGGELNVKCEGGCSGSCKGSANLAVSCEGTCEGTCEGDCSGTCSAQDGNGSCRGSCEGTCNGNCRGECAIDANANIECEGECSGSCSGTATAPKCEGKIDPPSCEVDADCNASCDASASAKAECKPPSIEIIATGNISVQAIGALKLHLPNIFLAAKARAEALVGAGEAVFTLSTKLDPGSLSGKAALCVVPAASAIATAFTNAEAGLSASLSVVASVGG